MIAYYRLPGVAAALALMFYALLMVILLSAFKINLSLPGIAGIILTVGMAVDANVIIFERVKEELGSGKTLRASIDSGFKRVHRDFRLESHDAYRRGCSVLLRHRPHFGLCDNTGIALSFRCLPCLSYRDFAHQLVGMKIKSLKAYGA